ncbi:hypothetical protein [Psychrobacillus sp.]|uniref:hypothetical protein n=1 Tax=Psychrobacillus sp. TaxID=1871623 RepID=UPI0028BEF6E9|nr:hypothetical protein [Psychrobacillus sp.]
MDFKAQMENDISNTFLNPDEFGENINFENEDVVVLIDDDEMKKRQLRKGVRGVHTEDLLFYVKRSAISFYPRPDNIVFYDNVKWLVVDCKEELGMLVVLCERTSA